MSADVKNWFSADELSMFGDRLVAGLPKSMSGSMRRAKKEGWVSREVKGSGGPGGVLTEYQPPADVLAQIHAFLEANPDFFGQDKKRVSRPLPSDLPASHKAVQEHVPYTVSPGTAALFDQQAVLWAAPAIRLAFMVRSTPRFAKSPDDMLQRVSILAFRFVFMFCDGDVQRINLWLNDASKTDGLVRMAYEGDCMKRGIAPGSDLNIKSE